MRRFLGITILSLLICPPAAAMPISEVYQLEETELVAIAKYFASREQMGARVDDAFLLLDWALKLTLTSKPSGNRFAEFGRLTIELTEGWPAFAVAVRATFAKFCAELPLRDASELWPALLRLRAEQ